MSWRPTDPVRPGPGRIARSIALLLAIALPGLSACDGRTSWRREPLPDYGEAIRPAPVPSDAPRVAIETDLGTVTLALYADAAPVTVANFLRYVDEGFYDGTLIHRVTRVPMVVVQGGGLLPGLEPKPGRAPIVNEAGNGLSNLRGTIAMARARPADSATSQFYFNVTDNPSLDRQGADRPGYAVFGVVIEGQEVVDRISMTPTHAIPHTPHLEVPVDDILIRSVRRIS